MRLIAAIEDTAVARGILECLKLSARAPPLEPATAGTPDLGHAEDDWLFDQTTDDDQP
jgi:hypothetical protein